MDKVLYLTKRREKYLVAAAVRFVRTVVSRNVSHFIFHENMTPFKRQFASRFVGFVIVVL